MNSYDSQMSPVDHSPALPTPSELRVTRHLRQTPRTPRKLLQSTSKAWESVPFDRRTKN
jgi:hypothetical protein